MKTWCLAGVAMVIDLSTAFAMRCARCGRLDVHHINVFQLSGENSLDFFCKCGSHKAAVERRGNKYISITYYCIICELEHNIIVPGEIFWSRKHMKPLVCLDTELNLGYFGSYRLIREELERQQQELDSMADELGFDEFANPEVMLEVLDFLHDIAAAGGLFCECGSHTISIELFADKLQLSCSNCNSIRELPAASNKDLEKIKSMDEVVIKYTTGRSKNF